MGLFAFLFPHAEHRLTTLEYRMALTDAALADLDAATNAVADELDELRGDLADQDSAVALRISAAADRLRGLAADPETPVPPVEEPAGPTEPETPGTPAGPTAPTPA